MKPILITRRETFRLAAAPMLAAAGAAAQSQSPSLPTTVLYYGRDAALPSVIPLRAGPFTMIFEPETGFLRQIGAGGSEAVRAIYSAVRDRNWGTVQPRINNLRNVVTADSFDLTFDVECRRGEIDFPWSGRISGDSAGVIRFSMKGIARTGFFRNRLGFCVLHPIQGCAGKPCEVRTTGGETKKGAFPEHISPHQPFFDMRAITHELAPGLSVEVEFEGDTFEMEDQRNWTDASYKTYCTPLALPFPVEVKAGTEVSQTVTIRPKGRAPAPSSSAADSEVVVRVGGEAGPMPPVGLGMASHGKPLTARERTRLKAMRLGHLRADLKPVQPDFRAAVRAAVTESKALGVPLEAALLLAESPDRDLAAVLEALDREKPVVASFLLYRADFKVAGADWVRLCRRELSKYAPKARFGAGTDGSFVEVNRTHPPASDLDFVCYSVTPQVHAIDNLTLTENLAAQADTVRSARTFSEGRPIVVTPVTLKMRYNPNQTEAPREPAPGTLPDNVDERQMSLFGAGWTLGSLKYLAETGVERITYYETTGWRGVMETESGSPAPFLSLPGGVFPIYHVLADAAEWPGARVLRAHSSLPLAVECLALRQGSRTRILLANLSGAPRVVRVELAGGGKSVRKRVLDETTVMRAMRGPEAFRSHPGALEESDGPLTLALRPYGLVRLDS